ncbi:hypothetical protein KY289_032019 [Solanum tuberosum]|nr:hypothetical protein KY289_032019 [Solanum tuberosum]
MLYLAFQLAYSNIQCTDVSWPASYYDADACNQVQQQELCLKQKLVAGPAPNSRVVYIDGAFDLFHAGHVEILRSARQHGDFLLVGIYPDQTVSELRGHQYPLMNLYERSLGVLACRYVDGVIIGAPWEVTQDMITTFNISLVVHGTVSESNSSTEGGQDPYAVPKSMGIFQVIESPKDITTSSVAQRIIANHEIYVVCCIKHSLAT